MYWRASARAVIRGKADVARLRRLSRLGNKGFDRPIPRIRVLMLRIFSRDSGGSNFTILCTVTSFAAHENESRSLLADARGYVLPSLRD